LKDLLTKDNLILYSILFILLASIGAFNLNFTGNQVISLNEIRVEAFGPLPSSDRRGSLWIPIHYDLSNMAKVEIRLNKLDANKKYKIVFSATNPNSEIINILSEDIGVNFDCNRNLCDVDVGKNIRSFSRNEIIYKFKVSIKKSVKESYICDLDKTPLWNKINLDACWDHYGNARCKYADMQKAADWWCKNKCGKEKAFKYSFDNKALLGTKSAPHGHLCTSCYKYFTRIECGNYPISKTKPIEF
jgi:hypothetical protein